MTATTRRGFVQIRWHGRGGQGVVTASNLLAEAALEDKRYFQSFPDYGAERSGAPIIAYTRLSDAPIHIRSQVTNPDIVMVLDASLIGAVDLLAGLGEEGTIVVNTSLSPDEVRERLNADHRTVCAVDGTQISMDVLGRNLPNVPILGGLLCLEEVVSQDAVKATIRHRLGARYSDRIVQANLDAFSRAYREATVG
ncbi:MAG: 2-oxoacid:acceptor oxidoreductase family protein [Dehalococcoidia bacterium]